MSFLVVANWKMNGCSQSFVEFTDKLSSSLNDKLSSDIEVVICPPFTALSAHVKLHPKISIGAQNCYYKKNGAYTGEISAEMLQKCGCKYVIVGHSERRGYFHESNEEIKLKAEAAIESHLCPIICIGETLEMRQNNQFREFIIQQCKDCLPTSGEYLVAYEPVWAIGQNSLPDIELINQVIDEIKNYNNELKIIYGGSVNHNNIDSVLQIKNICGVLIGSASLNCENFYNIICSINNCTV